MAQRSCPGCGDRFDSGIGAYSRKDNRVHICWPCSYFEDAAQTRGDRLVSPGYAVRKGKPDREQFNRRTQFLR